VRTIALLEALSEKSVRTPTYSEAAKTGLQQTSKGQKITVSSSQKERSFTEAARKDERAISIDTGRTKAEKARLAHKQTISQLHKEVLCFGKQTRLSVVTNEQT